MLQAVIGISDDIDLSVAIEKVISSCRLQLGSLRPRAGILFTSCMDADFPGILGRILREFPGLHLVGCTTDGEISRPTGFIEDSLALLLLSSDTVEFSSAIAQNLSANAQTSLQAAFHESCRDLHSLPVCAFVFPDNRADIAISIEAALHQVFGGHFPVFGGMAADHSLPTGALQFHGNQVYSDAAPILVLAGDLALDVAVRKGPVPTGLHVPLGRHDGNRVFEIDGKTAVAFYRENFGCNLQQIGQFPLAVYREGKDEYYLSDPDLINEEDGSISFVNNFPDQCSVRLTLVSRSDVLKTAEQANRHILRPDKSLSPEVAFIFACTSLRYVLGSRTDEKFTLLQKDRSEIPFFGFYCYGEIAPLTIGSPSQFHNDTYVIVTLGSRKI
jgi:hypothetical protein